MKLPLSIHLSIHFILAVLVGYLVGQYFGIIWLGIIAGILGGFFIDLDHILEYFLVFGLHFNFIYFLKGHQFLISNKMYLWFHAWEYVLVISIIIWVCWHQHITSMVIFLTALNLCIALHLITDCIINQFPPKNYSLIYRWNCNFSTPRLLSLKQYQGNLEQKQKINMRLNNVSK